MGPTPGLAGAEVAARNASAGDVEITLPDGNTLALMLDRDPTAKPGTPYGFESVLSAASAQSPIAPRLTTRIIVGFRRGMGLDYNAAYGCYTRDGYAMPFGAATGVDLSSGPLAAHSTASPIVAFAELNGTLYVAQQGLGSGFGGRVLKFVGGTGVAVEDMFLLAGDLIRDMIVADNGSGVTCLYVTSESATHTNARLHQLNGSTGVWTHTTAGTEFAATRGLGRMAYEFMQPDSSPGDYRIVSITGPKTFAYTLPNANPMGTGAAGSATANWSPDIKVGTRGQLVDIAAARRHFWLAATDNLFDVDELGNSNGVTSFLPQMQQSGNGQAVLYMDGYVYMSVGRGLIRLRVDQGPVLQERPQQCAPGWGTRAENEVRGPITALCPDQGGFFSNTYNPSTQKSYICWNAVRDFETDESRNPLIAHGPEVVIGAAYRGTRMLTSGLAGDLRLWIGSVSVPGNNARLDWVSLPIAGSPLQDLVSGGPMRFVTGTTGGPTDPPPPTDPPVQTIASLETLLDDWEDGGASNVILYADTFVTRGLSGQFHEDGSATDDGAGSKLGVSSRCDPTPGQTTWGTRILVTGSPAQTVLSTQNLITGKLLQGHKTQMKIDFINPYGGGNSPDGAGGFTGPVRVGVLDAIRRLGWKEEPSVRVFTLRVVYGDGVPLPFGRDPEDVTSLLKSVTESPTTGFLTYQGRRFAVKFDQVLDIHEEWRDGGGFGKTVHATMQGSILDLAP